MLRKSDAAKLRVTLGLPATLVVHPSFNPHTHAGCDMSEIRIFGDGIVSIHTPTQGVT